MGVTTIKWVYNKRHVVCNCPSWLYPAATPYPCRLPPALKRLGAITVCHGWLFSLVCLTLAKPKKNLGRPRCLSFFATVPSRARND